jgi:hypothetical protein
VDEYFKKQKSDENTIFIHFGVNSASYNFKIEQRAKNGKFLYNKKRKRF